MNIFSAASEKKFSEFLNYSRGELDRMKKVLNSETSAKDDLMKRITDVCKEKDLNQNWANDLRLKFNKQDLTISKTQQKIAEIEEFKNQIVEEKNRKISELQADTSKLEAEIKGNKTLTNVLKEIEETIKVIDQLSIERDNLTNKVRSLEFSKDLIDKT